MEVVFPTPPCTHVPVPGLPRVSLSTHPDVSTATLPLNCEAGREKQRLQGLVLEGVGASTALGCTGEPPGLLALRGLLSFV